MKRVLVLVVSLLCLQACAGSAAEPLCGGRTSVAAYVIRFGQGLANFDDGSSLALEADSVSVLDVVLAARDADTTRTAAESLAAKLGSFIGVMNGHDWIISDSLDDPRALSTSDALGTEESLREANTVEALVLQTCGSDSVPDAPVDSAETLPPPSYQAPTDTSPDAALPDDSSDAASLGRTVGIQFGLTLTQRQVECLGLALQGISDVTEAFSSPAQYQKQFQAAFDQCGIPFEVPDP